uniref:Uncharacterized protein n=1 Tax=Rhizophora mucronata TaxID=61149 RepID=A0A2P2R4C1_RHIMU
MLLKKKNNHENYVNTIVRLRHTRTNPCQDFLLKICGLSLCK